MARWLDGTVKKKILWNRRLCSLSIESELHDFIPGQFCRVGLEIDGDILARPYSLINAPREAELEIYFNLVPGGPLSPKLFTLEAGDSLLVAPRPAGFFTLEEVPDGSQLWMLATGTGLGPYISMLKTTEVWQRFDKIILVHGVRSEDELSYSAFFNSLAASHPKQFCKINSLTRQEEGGSADHLNFKQRIPQLIADGTLEKVTQLKFSAKLSQVMACGNPNMITDCLEQLKLKGLTKNTRREPGNFTSEAYQ